MKNQINIKNTTKRLANQPAKLISLVVGHRSSVIGTFGKLKFLVFTFAFLLFTLSLFAQQQRFPKPEFDSGYVQPSPETPEPRGLAMEYIDVLVLLLVLSAATYFVLKSRSRQGVLWLSLFTLVYFGFYRNGCICSIGAIQNVTLTFFDATYVLSLTALLFFILPLFFTLFFG